MLENYHLPNHRCCKTSVFLYDLYEDRNGKVKTWKETDFFCSFFRDRILQVSSGSSGTSGMPGPTVPDCRKAENSHRSILTTKIHKEAQYPNILVIIIKKKKNHKIHNRKKTN